MTAAMDDYEVMSRRRDQEDARRGYSISGGGGWVRSIESRTIAPPVSPVVIDTDTRNVVIGYSLLFNQIIQHGNGTLMMVRPTAFKDLQSGTTKYFQHQHDNNIRVASTKDYLTLHADEIGIAFKLYIPSTELGRQTRDFVRTNTKQSMSAHFSATNYEKHIVEDGIEVCLVLEAELHEISICETGANSDAFAVLVEDSAEWVTDMCRSMRMSDEMNRSHVRRALRRLEALRDSSPSGMDG
jgi:HK97 family phage prohead protease